MRDLGTYFIILSIESPLNVYNNYNPLILKAIRSILLFSQIQKHVKLILGGIFVLTP